MQKVEPNQLLAEAKRLANQGKNWHFHLLLKKCTFNVNQGKYALVLEGEDGKARVCLFVKKPEAQAKMLAGMMYGKDFLEVEGGEHNPKFEELVKIAEKLAAKGEEWHHHHLHPQCILNQSRGKHCIVLEDEAGKNLSSVEYTAKPKGDLARIERLFYQWRE